MKRIIANAIILSFFLSSASMASVDKKNLVVERTAVEILVKKFKKSILLKKSDPEIAIKELVGELIDKKVSIEQLKSYVQGSTSLAQYKKFEENLDTLQTEAEDLSQIGSSELSFLLKMALDQTATTGSHFMSCKAGMQVGVPLVIVGVIVGIVAIVNSQATLENTMNYSIKSQYGSYDEYRRQKTAKHLEEIDSLKEEIQGYEESIAYYSQEIRKLETDLGNNNYSSSELEDIYQLIRDYRFEVTDAEALIEEVKVDMEYFEQSYESAIERSYVNESSDIAEVEERNLAAKSQAVAAGVFGGLGGVFIGLSVSDC